MSKKFTIVDNALVMQDTITSVIELDEPAKDVYFDNYALNKGFILITQKDGSRTADIGISNQIAISSAVDSNDVIFDVDTFRAFARLSLGKSSLVTGAIERLIDGESTAISQNPTGLGIANSIQVEYGVAIGNANTDVMLALDGTLTFNKAGTYRIKIAIQFGRVGNPSASKILFRVIDSNGDQLGRSVGYLISSGDETKYFENDTWLPVTAGLTVRTEVMRDSSGVNTGGLVSITPTDEGVNTWNFAPTAAIRVERFI